MPCCWSWAGNRDQPPVQAQVGGDRLVGRLGPGDYFGEIALLCRKPRQATVRATSSVTLLRMDRESFTRLCGGLEGLLQGKLSRYTSDEIKVPAGQAKAPAPDDDEESSVGGPPPPLRPGSGPGPVRAGQARRGSVFVEPVVLEAGWVPPVHAKTAEEETRLRGYLARTALLSHLDARTQQTMIGAVIKVAHPDGADIIQQGADGDFYYILDTGRADVFIRKGGAEETKVLEYGPGGAFGELALLHGEPRLATVRAVGQCECWALDRDTFRKVMMSSGRQSMQERTTFLSQVEILKDLSPFDRFKMAEAMESREIVPGTIVVREGDLGDDFFIIQAGVCDVIKSAHGVAPGHGAVPGAPGATHQA